MSETPEHLVRALWQAFDEGRFDDVQPLLADDFVAEWPQTNERIVGPANFIALNTTYPGRWRCILLDLLGDGRPHRYPGRNQRRRSYRVRDLVFYH